MFTDILSIELLLFCLPGLFNGETDAAMMYASEIEPYLKQTPQGK